MDEHLIIFNNKNSYEDFGLLVAEPPTISATNENFEAITIEGRNGDLIEKKGTYSDKVLNFKFELLDDEDYYDRLEEVKEWLHNIEDNRLIYSNYDRCYRVKAVEMGDISKDIGLYGKFDVTFTAEPFLTSIEEINDTITESGYSFYYPSPIPAEPVIKVYGNGNITLTVNSEEISIENVDTYVKIDSKLMNTIGADGESKDNAINGDFPLLTQGINTISWVGNVTTVDVVYLINYR